MTADTSAGTSAGTPAGGAEGVTRGAGWLGLGAGVVKAVQTVVLLLLAALLAPSAIGVLAIGALVLNVTTALTDLGSSTALVHWRGDAERAARSALSLAVGLAVAITAAMWFAAPAVAHVLNAGELGSDVLRGLMLCLPMYAVAGVSQELLRRELAFKRRVLPDIVGALSGGVLSVTLALLGHGAMSLVIGQLVQAALVMVLCWAMRPAVRPGWRGSDVAALISYGGHLAGANLLTLLMLNVDYLVVAHELGAFSLGVYSMAFRLAYMPYLLVAVVIAGAAFAHLCRLRGAAVGAAVGEVAARMTVLLVPLYLGVVLLAPQLELLGAQWAAGVRPLRWLAVYGLVLSLLHLGLIALNAVGRTRDSFWLGGLHLALLTALLVTFVGRGVEAVAVAQVVAGLATLLVTLPVLARRIQGLDPRRWLGATRAVLAGAAAMTTVVLLAEALLPWTRVSYPGLALVGSAAVTTYLAVVLRLDQDALIPRLPALRRMR
ncbi:oligosaccharide flippase family protein [Nocardioides sp. zg-536]|uniref:Oligosaccharide flippase family protein n=1 Tax=Nocardioides faecalis TaxID=2803858 RepID=A0A939BXN7_9ACTN|nr:oligosaccharide flippase family protein [Nocardioides faecalis]MBM9459508.1 oligosaccharide flippase family protein [Nocardioides faecalis]QVI58046.1 oligosaccharide flippase family protein [Nocardioides faecalis]